MDYSLGALAIVKQQEMLREARERARGRDTEKELAVSRQRDRQHGFRRLLHR